MYAIIKTGGKQYRVSVGDVVFVEKMNAQEEENVEFEVLAVGKEDGLVVGTPVVEGAKVAGKVIKNGKSKKVTVFTYRSKKDSKRKMGHRQPYTRLGSLPSTHNDPCGVYKIRRVADLLFGQRTCRV